MDTAGKKNTKILPKEFIDNSHNSVYSNGAKDRLEWMPNSVTQSLVDGNDLWITDSALLTGHALAQCRITPRKYKLN